jgi:hypothetical protein
LLSEKKIKFFKTSLNNKNSNSLSYKNLSLFYFFPKNGGVVVVFSFLLLRPPRTSEALKKVQILDS